MTEQEIKLQCLELAVDIASQSEESIDINEVLDDAESLFDFVNSKTDSQKINSIDDFKDLMKEWDSELDSVFDDELIKDNESKSFGKNSFSHNHDYKSCKAMSDIIKDTESKAVLTMQLIQDKSHKFKMRLVGNKLLCELDVEITLSGYLKYDGKVADTISAFINTRK